MKTIRCRVIQGMVMPDGWHFQVNPSLRLEADTFPELIKVVEEYRVSNNMPIGEPLDDVVNYICSTYPHQCHQVPGATVSVEVERPAQKKISLLDRIIGWFDRQTRRLDSSAIVLSMEAQQRAAICAKCRFNVNWKTGCGQCSDNINRLSKLVRQGHSIPAERKLKACSILGQENRAAVFLQQDRLESSPELPSWCWVKKHEDNLQGD